MNRAKVVGIAGSPRRAGNSERLLDRAMAGARDKGAEVEKIIVSDLKIAPCQECLLCVRTGECTIKDDFQLVQNKIREAEGIIIASPIFFTSVPAQLKTMIDRFQCVWAWKCVLKKQEPWERGKRRGVFISVSGLRQPRFFENASQVIKAFFFMIGATYTGELFCPGIAAEEGIEKYPDCLNRATELGGKIIKG